MPARPLDSNPLRPDVLIIGGGPAGSTAAALLARAGREVVVIEKERHPRFHIGESLLPMNLPLLERLGVADAVREIGVPKPGADFTCDEDLDSFRTYHFSRSLTPCPPSAYEVRRSEFDHLLLRHAAAQGATVRERTTAAQVVLEANGRHRVQTRDAQGNTQWYRPGFVLDASGRDALLASREGWKQKNPAHASAAVFGHFRGVARRDGADAGNISIYWFADGWIWMIPLRDDVVSVGAVCWPDYLKQRRGDLENFLMDTLKRSPPAHARMVDAELTDKVRAAGNYSYRSRRLHGPGYALVGDAFAFVDPIFSSGVYLAMSGAERVVEPVEAWLDGKRLRYAMAMRRYRRLTRRGISGYSWFIYRFTSPAMRNLFRNPRNIFGVEQAVVSMLAGDVFGRGKAYRRLLIFRIIFAISYLISLGDSLRHGRRKRRNAAIQIPDTVST